jgi:serine/threonine protein phosphatase PrpC
VEDQEFDLLFLTDFTSTNLMRFSSGETSGTTATFVIVDRWTVTVASVGDSRCILDTQGGAVTTLTVDHRLEENIEEYVNIDFLMSRVESVESVNIFLYFSWS